MTWRGTLSVRMARLAVMAAMLAIWPAMAAMGQMIASRPQPRPAPLVDVALWDSQDALVGKSLAQLPHHAADRPNVYAVAIAPHGTQTLFSREARMALDRLAAKYGGTASAGILLSNGPPDIMQVPLATNANIGQVLNALGRRTQAKPDDVVIVYLTSHGSPDATLESALPGNLPVMAVSARSLATALDEARVRRRVVIISACFAGSWIPALANDDTIVITAAAADRTSFGCAEDRPLTYFGEAFLTGPLSRGASLAASFESAKKTVAQWEEAQKLPFSQPQVFVGRNMTGFWQGTSKSGGTRTTAAAR